MKYTILVKRGSSAGWNNLLLLLDIKRDFDALVDISANC